VAWDWRSHWQSRDIVRNQARQGARSSQIWSGVGHFLEEVGLSLFTKNPAAEKELWPIYDNAKSLVSDRSMVTISAKKRLLSAK